MQRLIEFILMCIASLICSAQHLVIDYPQYRSTYDTLLQVPSQIEYSLTLSDLGKAKRSPSWKFTNDIGYQSIKATNNDYIGSGYHRGHMCPAADRSKTREYMRTTFLMSNVAPQTPSVNCGSWLHTETYVRQKIRRYDTIDVLVIPVFLHRDTAYIGEHHIAVPHAFFKSAWIHGTDSVIGSWFIFNK